MNWLQTLAVVFHMLLAVAIIALVLLQRGKGADAGAGFGAGASGTVFGARGSASFLSRTTAVLATLFFLTSLGLAYLFSRGKEAPASVMDRAPASRRRSIPLRCRPRPHPNPRRTSAGTAAPARGQEPAPAPAGK